MHLKTIKPTYQGRGDAEKLSMLISYCEELGDELAFRIGALKDEIDMLRRILTDGSVANSED